MPYRGSFTDLPGAMDSAAKGLWGDPSREAEAKALGSQARNWDATALHTGAQTADLQSQAAARARLADIFTRFRDRPGEVGPELLAGLQNAGIAKPADWLGPAMANNQIGTAPISGTMADNYNSQAGGVKWEDSRSGRGQTLAADITKQTIASQPLLNEVALKRDQATANNYYEDDKGNITYQPLGSQPAAGINVRPGTVALKRFETENNNLANIMLAKQKAAEWAGGYTSYTNINDGQVQQVKNGDTPPSGPGWMTTAQAVDINKNNRTTEAGITLANTGDFKARQDLRTFVNNNGQTWNGRLGERPPDDNTGWRPVNDASNTAAVTNVRYIIPGPGGRQQVITLRADERPPPGAIPMNDDPGKTMANVGAFGTSLPELDAPPTIATMPLAIDGNPTYGPPPIIPGAKGADVPMSSIFTDASRAAVDSLGRGASAGTAPGSVGIQQDAEWDEGITSRLSAFNEERPYNYDITATSSDRAAIRARASALLADQKSRATFRNQPQALDQAVQEWLAAKQPENRRNIWGFSTDTKAPSLGQTIAKPPGTAVTTPPKPTAAAALEPAPAPAQRVVGREYSTPRGPMRWMGSGWVNP
jgi:hypothetical protein